MLLIIINIIVVMNYTYSVSNFLWDELSFLILILINA